MKAFVINLPKDTERRAFMEKQLNVLSIPFEIMPATVGLNLTEDDITKLYNNELTLAENGHPLSKTQIACSDSHRRIYQKIKMEKLPYALVLEDDVVLDKRITSILNDDFISKSKADWIQLDYVPMNSDFFKNWWVATKRKVSENPFFLVYFIVKLPWVILWGCYEYLRERLLLNSFPRVAHFARPLYLASAYIITEEGVNKILPLVEPIRFAADRVQNQARIKKNLRLMGVVPLLGRQARETFSSNLIYDNE